MNISASQAKVLAIWLVGAMNITLAVTSLHSNPLISVCDSEYLVLPTRRPAQITLKRALSCMTSFCQRSKSILSSDIYISKTAFNFDHTLFVPNTVNPISPHFLPPRRGSSPCCCTTLFQPLRYV